MNETRKVVSGEPLSIPANTWNKLIDLVEPGSRPSAEPFGVGGYPSVQKVLVKNNYTGGILPNVTFDRFDVVAIDYSGTTPFIDSQNNIGEFKNRPNFYFRYATYPAQPCAVLLEPLEPGGIGWAAISGIVPVRVNITETDHDFATVTNSGSTDGYTYLTSSRVGTCRMLWREGGATATGIKWAYVALPGMANAVTITGRGYSWNQGPYSGVTRIDLNQTDFLLFGTSLDGGVQINLNRASLSTSSWMGY